MANIYQQTPEEREQDRLLEANNEKLILENQNLDNVDSDKIINSTPSELKAMGIAKLPLLLLTVGNQVKIIIQPSLNNIVKQYIKKYNSQGVCLTQQELDKLRQQRDLIVSQLNKIGKTLNVITISLTGVSTFLNILETTIKGIDLAKIAAKIAAITNPALAATLPTVLNTLNTAKTTALLDEQGNSRLSKLSSIIGSAGLVASIIGGYILKATQTLQSIDIVLTTCDPNNSFLPISKEIQTISDTQQQANITQNQSTYQGFIIEIEEIPYTSTVTRRRAVGRNQQGIVLIQTELSFTTDNQTLINELKLIIDSKNLKAY
jgi:hypothetical protein